MSRVSKLSLRRDTLTIRYLGCGPAARACDSSGSWARTICGVFIAGRSGAKLQNWCLSSSSTAWAQVSTLPPARPDMHSPESAFPNTPPPPCPIEKPPSGLFCTVPNRHSLRLRCAHCGGDGFPAALPAGCANQSEQGTAANVKTNVEIKRASPNRRRSPSTAGVERSGRGDYLQVDPVRTGAGATYRKDQKP